MSTWCEIVRYRANMKAVLALTYVKSLQGPEKLFKRSEKQSTPKTLLRYSKFDPLNCPVDGVHSKVDLTSFRRIVHKNSSSRW
jgi:hypothetical protein